MVHFLWHFNNGHSSYILAINFMRTTCYLVKRNILSFIEPIRWEVIKNQHNNFYCYFPFLKIQHLTVFFVFYSVIECYNVQIDFTSWVIFTSFIVMFKIDEAATNCFWIFTILNFEELLYLYIFSYFYTLFCQTLFCFCRSPIEVRLI